MQPQDFRGYLYQQQQAGDSRAGAFLNYVGGDYAGQGTAGLNTDKLNYDATQSPSIVSSMGGVNPAINNLQGYYAAYTQANQPKQTGTVSTSKVDPNFVNAAYDTKIAGLRSVMDTLQPQQDAATLNVGNQYQNQANTLQTQKTQGQRNLQLASDQVQQSKVRSLDDLRRQVETQGMSYNSQLGAYGAGDSSAAGMIQQALSGQASRNRGQVLQGAGQQDQQIALQGQDLETDYSNNMKMLDDWKSSSLNDIATKFLQQKQQIQQQMVGADADRYQALAQADAAYTQRAIQQLGALQDTYRQNAQGLISQYQQIQGPNVKIADNLTQYAVNPLTAGQIQSIGAVPGVSTDTNPVPIGQRRNFQDEYGLSLQGY